MISLEYLKKGFTRGFDVLSRALKARYLILTLIFLFLILSAFVYFIPTTFIDIEFSEEIQEERHPLLDILMKAISWFGASKPIAGGVILGVAAIFFLARYRKEALFIMGTSVVTLFALGLKILINRPRPTEQFVTILENAQYQSFPSGHTAFYVTFFGFITFLMIIHKEFSNPLRILVSLLCLGLIFSVPVSRVYLGAHWFTDVAAGFVLGLLVLIALIFWYLRSNQST